MKKIGKILLVIVCFFTLTLVVKATDDDGGGLGRGGGAGSGGCTGTNIQCNNNKYGPYFKLTLYYIQQGAPWEKIGDSYFVAGSDANKNVLTQYGVDAGHILVIPSIGTNATDENRFRIGDKALRCYYDQCSDLDGTIKGNDNSNMNALANANLVDLLKRFTGREDYSSVLTKDSVPINFDTPATYGYRIIIEPVFLFFNNSKPSFAATPRQLAFEKKGNSSYKVNGQSYPVTKDLPSSTKKPTMMQALFISYTDVGISNPGGDNHDWNYNENVCANISYTDVSDTNGCGMNIIDVGKYIKPNYCWVKKIHNGTVKCELTDQENTGTFSEEYTEEICDKKKEEENSGNTKYGKLIRTSSSGNCKLYGIETTRVSLPGAISKNNPYYNLNTTSYFAWPARGEVDSTGAMHAVITDMVRFTIDGSCSASDRTELIEAAKSTMDKAKFQIKLTGGDFEQIDENLVVGPTEKNYNVQAGANRFTFSKSSYMQISDIKNRIYNSTSNAVFDRKTYTPGVEIDRREGVVSFAIHKIDAGGNKKYTLTLSDLKFGINDGGTFGIKNYSCGVEIGREKCLCYDGYLNISIDEYVNAGRTCRQAQEAAEKDRACETYCLAADGTKVYTTTCVLKYMKTGMTQSEAERTCRDLEPKCKQTVPPSGTKYYCTSTKDGSYIDITSCVTKNVTLGMTKDRAQAECINATPECSDKGTPVPVCEAVEKGQLSESVYNACIDQYTRAGRTQIEAREICDNSYCECVVNGKVPDNYIRCIQKGNKVNTCKLAYCVEVNTCTEMNICLTCNVNCKWYQNADLSTTHFSIRQECDNTTKGEDDCGHRIIEKGCNLSCVQQELNTTDIVGSLNNKTIDVKDLDDAIYACSNKCYSQNSTSTYCDDSGVCSYNKEDNVIFRVIDLDNPFPGTSIRTNAYSNTESTSRYPGPNFDSVITVEEVILKARGAAGEDLYNKSPLWTITVTPTQAQNIQKYNKEHPLSDFDLKCSDGRDGCVSEFLHDYQDLYVTISSDSQKSACITYNLKTEQGYKACYEGNN